MANKVWHKSLLQRKIWNKLSIYKKTCYYLQPFVENVVDIWCQPLPFPSILKLFETLMIILIALLPIIYLIFILSLVYAEFQFFVKSYTGLEFPKQYNLIEFLKRILILEKMDESHATFLSLYVERWRLILTAITSSVDYFRLSCYLLFGVGE